jgi:hypothetical protein
MWSAVLPNREVRLIVKAIAAAILFAVLFFTPVTEVEFVYTGF